MKALLATAVAVATLTASSAAIETATKPYPSGLVLDPNPAEPFLLTPEPHTYVKAADLPTDFSWCKHTDGANYCTPITNQHIPKYCGSCWAQSALSAFADRIKHRRKAAFPDIVLSPQHVTYCQCNGCRGGDSNQVHYYLKTVGTVEESCQAYVGLGSGRECTPMNTCMNCDPGDTPCYPITNYTRFFASEYGTVRGIDNIKAEIVTRGPVVCYLNAEPIYQWGFGDNRRKIFTEGKNRNQLNHAISVVGYGVEAGTPYWTIRNSWGSYWGDEGYFRLKLGENQLGMENNGCYWAVPKL